LSRRALARSFCHRDAARFIAQKARAGDARGGRGLGDRGELSRAAEMATRTHRRALVQPRRFEGLGVSMAMSHDADRSDQYRAVRARLEHLLEDENDWIAALATVVCELHNEFSHFDWTGFYRVVSRELLVIGPYQGTHGCLRIPFARGVCGAAARTRSTQRVDQVASRADHIACSGSTQSEIVVPVLAPGGDTLAVLDVDSDQEAAFGDVDQEELEAICRDLGRRFPHGEGTRRES
jgi:L-methionine (R)-S-oxide reductase